jgi:hypothetical protein
MPFFLWCARKTIDLGLFYKWCGGPGHGNQFPSVLIKSHLRGVEQRLRQHAALRHERLGSKSTDLRLKAPDALGRVPQAELQMERVCHSALPGLARGGLILLAAQPGGFSCRRRLVLRRL